MLEYSVVTYRDRHAIVWEETDPDSPDYGESGYYKDILGRPVSFETPKEAEDYLSDMQDTEDI